MGTVNPNRAGLVLATMLGGWHFLWALLVAAAWAQPVINFVFRIHFLSPSWVVGQFHAGLALLLIMVTGSLGYVGGYLLGVLWNWIHA